MTAPVFDNDGNLLDNDGTIIGVPVLPMIYKELATPQAQLDYLTFAFEDEDTTPEDWILALETCLESAKQARAKVEIPA